MILANQNKLVYQDTLRTSTVIDHQYALLGMDRTRSWRPPRRAFNSWSDTFDQTISYVVGRF